MVAMAVPSFGVENQFINNVEIFDFDGNLVENPDLNNLWKYGAIFNSNGTIDILSTLAATRSRTEFVNSTKTLASGKYWQSYQYHVVQGLWLVGTGTCSSSGVEVERYFSESIGGTRALMESTPLSSSEFTYPHYDGNMDAYINFIYRNSSSTSRTFNVHIYTF